jgi:hypothetical protein
MPLAFPSRSHGPIAFGFFQIEIDMLLLDPLFFFADRFCRAVGELAERAGEERAEVQLGGWRISDPARVGDLHGAIQGRRLSGFIGETYRRFPFPADPAGFKQKPDGARNREWAAALIERFGARAEFELAWDSRAATLSIAEFVFDADAFRELIGYVEVGGYPRWLDGNPPAYVRELQQVLKRTRWLSENANEI